MSDFNPQSLAQLDRDRFSSYKNNLDFYNGQQWTERSRNRQLVFNYAKVAVDKITSYLMEGLNFACDPLEEGTQPKSIKPMNTSWASLVIARSEATKQSQCTSTQTGE